MAVLMIVSDWIVMMNSKMIWVIEIVRMIGVKNFSDTVQVPTITLILKMIVMVAVVIRVGGGGGIL